MVLWVIAASVIGFFLAFAVGPVIFFRAVRLPQRAALVLILGMTACLGLGLWLRAGLEDAVGAATVLLALWVAWLLGCAALVLALRPRLDAVRWRWARMLGAAATTAPWFGFAAAQFAGG